MIIGQEGSNQKGGDEVLKTEIMTRIEQYIQLNQPFLDPEFSLSDLSKAILLHTRVVSSAIKSTLGMGFPEYISKIRFNYMEEMLQNKPEVLEFSIDAIAKMVGFSSRSGFYKAFKNRPVYSTWLGTKMPKDVDLSVLTNVLLMHTIAKIPLNATDSASLDLIVDLVKANKHLTDPKLVSQHYAYSATIIYHIARLIYFSNYPPLLALKPILLNQALNLSKESKFPLEQLLLNTSILRLGGKMDLPMSVNEVSLIDNDYPYFVANIACILNNPFKRIVNRSNIVRFDYYSYAFNLSLLYENLMLRGD